MRTRLASIQLDALTEISVSEEIAQHVEDRFDYLRSEGWTDQEALDMSLRELEDEALARELGDVLGDA